MASQSTLLSVSLLLVCCGGSQTPPNNNGNVDAGAPVSSSSATPAADAGPPKQSIESQREPFVQACMRKMPTADYCSCAFDQFRDVFKDADLTQKPSDAQFETLKQKTAANCASKLNENDVKQIFSTVCISGEPKKNSFCECEWTSLRKKLALADFISDFEGPRFDEAKKSMAATCKGKLPDEVAKSDFMAGCNKSSNGATKACECMWKKIRVKSSPEEIAAGAVDVKAAGIESCKDLK